MPNLPIADIEIGKRYRKIVSERVTMLADSIAEIGLQNPVSVAEVSRYRDGQEVLVFELVAGLHRLEACKSLGLVDIEAKLIDLGEIDRELWEIDENLMRAELTELERGEHLARRKELFEAKSGTNCPTSLSDGRVAGPQHQKAFAADTAAKTGVTKRDINRSIRRAEKITGKVKDQIRNTSIAESGVELDALASMKPDQQKKAVNQVLSGNAKNIREAKQRLVTGVRRTHDQEGDEKQLASLQSAWNRASAAARESFLDWLHDNEPTVFDRTNAGRAA